MIYPRETLRFMDLMMFHLHAATRFQVHNSFVKIIALIYNLTYLDVLNLQKNKKKMFVQTKPVENRESFSIEHRNVWTQQNIQIFMKFLPENQKKASIFNFSKFLYSEKNGKFVSKIEILEKDTFENLRACVAQTANPFREMYIEAFQNEVLKTQLNSSLKFGLMKDNFAFMTQEFLFCEEKCLREF